MRSGSDQLCWHGENMLDKTENELVNIVRPLFPENAEIYRRPSSDGLTIGVVWKLRSDQSRPNKRSRRIVLVLSQEALEDCNEDYDKLKKQIVVIVSNRLKSFNPNHDAPYGQQTSPEIVDTLG